MSDYVFIDGGPPLGLPPATALSLNDLIVVAQNGTPGVAATATDRAATLAQLFGALGSTYLPLIGGTMQGGISFGAVVGAANTDLSKHLTLHTAGYGLGITNNRLNIVAPGTGTINMTLGGVDRLSFTGTLATVGTPWLFQNSNTRHVNSNTYNISSGNISSQSDPWEVSFVNVANAGGAATPIDGHSTVHSFQIQDRVSSNLNVQGVNIVHNIAPNGGVASGTRVGLGVTLSQIGTLQGGTITNAAISSGAVINAWGASNLGGVANLYAGGLNALNPVMRMLPPATFLRGGSGVEINTSAVAGTSYFAWANLVCATLNEHAVRGYLNANYGIYIGAQVGALADVMYGIGFAGQDSQNTIDPFGRLIFSSIGHGNVVTTVATAEDFGNLTIKAFSTRHPYSQVVPLQANNFTTATRLTSDGLAPSSFVYDAIVTNAGGGYTSFPTVTVTGGTGVVINGAISGQAMSRPGVFNPGTNVPPEATAVVTGGGATINGTMALQMAGNTLNFPINSAVDFDARVVMRSTTGEAICWACEFGARMGATASTTAIIGAPTWTQVWATAGAAAAIGISPPTADTTLGAINITVTPTSLTWSGGGRVSMTKSLRV